MTYHKYTYRLALIIIISILSTGCATQTRSMKDLASEVQTNQHSESQKSVSVISVTGGEKTQQSTWVMNTPKVDNEQFKELLIGSLKKSGLFKDVTSNSSGDYLLSAEIIFQEMTVGGMSNTLMLLVKYQLTDSRSGKVIFKQNIYTQTDLSVSDVFAGNVRVVRLLEKGLILNMNTLIKKIQSVIV